MNCSTYIFGELSDGYSQYPEDNSSKLFSYINSQCNAPSQLIIHRDENMMYYVYIRKFDKKKYIGLAIAINSYYFTQIKTLFSLFEKEIERLAVKGIIIKYSKNGDLTPSISSLTKEEEEVLSYINTLQTNISTIRTVKRIPQADYAISISSLKIFNENDNNSEIVTASYTFGYTIILKQTNYDTLRSTSYQNTLKLLNSQIESIAEELQKAKETNKQILRQKKQFKKVIILSAIVIACGFGLYFLNENLTNTQDELISANSLIQLKDSIIENKNSRIVNMSDSIDNLETTLKKTTREKTDLLDQIQKISTHYPFIVTSYDITSERIKFDYYCTEQKEITITLKAINDKNSEIASNNHTLTFYKGEGSKTLNFSKKINNSSFYGSTQYYYIVLIYNGHIIAGKYW